jgi:Co/Zn/Cd efflux system component
MNKTTFHIPKMDCPSEEQMIRMTLGDEKNIHSLSFHIPDRRLIVYHQNNPLHIASKIGQLRLGSKIVESTEVDLPTGQPEDASQHRLLWTVLLINFSCFILELTTGFFSRSMALVADSLDMLADAFVYGLALFAVGGTMSRKKAIASAAGYLQLALAVLGFAEVVRRFLGYDVAPVFGTMITVAIIALAGNAISLWLLQRSKSTDAHMKASMIFTSNDVIINLGVILAGVLVYFTDSNRPDLIIGTLVFVIVTRGAFKILQLGQ